MTVRDRKHLMRLYRGQFVHPLYRPDGPHRPYQGVQKLAVGHQNSPLFACPDSGLPKVRQVQAWHRQGLRNWPTHPIPLSR